MSAVCADHSYVNEVFSPQSKVRLALLAPFLLLMASTIALMAASLTAYGVADDFGYKPWVPATGALLFAIPVLVGSALFARAVWLRTLQPFRLQKLRFILGLLSVVAVIAITVAYIVLVNDPMTYRSNEIDSITHRYKPNLTPESFLSFSLLMALFFPCGGFAIAAKFLYLGAINAVGLSKPAGIDAIGEIMRGQAAQKA